MTTKAERQAVLDYAMSAVQLDIDGYITNEASAVEALMKTYQVSQQVAIARVWQAARRIRYERTPSPGRPATLDDGANVTVYLPAAMVAKARRLGDGNVSEGVRRCIEAHDELDES